MSTLPRTHNSDGRRARGSSNGDARGNHEQRRRRRAWLLETYASDVKLCRVEWSWGVVTYEPYLVEAETLLTYESVLSAVEVPTARCYRCGCLLHDGTITVDRIIPGAHGGTYARNNIRPACGKDNSSTGATVRRKPGRT